MEGHHAHLQRLQVIGVIGSSATHDRELGHELPDHRLERCHCVLRHPILEVLLPRQRGVLLRHESLTQYKGVSKGYAA